MNKTLDIRTGDLLKVKEGAIAHQVNLRGKMGKGLAKDLRELYPKIYDTYSLAIQKKQLALGDVQMVEIVPQKLYVANLVGQDNYGKGKHTDYVALDIGLSWLNQWQECTSLPVYLPYQLGAGNGGGDWSEIEKIIARCIPSAIILKKN
jgi:O-acetyl-ADP-ribose deacetylase (regulator of RNase III)